MRHTMRSGALVLALVAAGAATQLRAQAARPGTPEATVNMAVPASIQQLDARQVVEQVIAQRHDLLLDLLLSDQQFAELSSLSQAVRDGRPIYEPTARTKPPYQRPVKISTPEQALARAFAVLTPQQQHQSLMLFAKLEPKTGK